MNKLRTLIVDDEPHARRYLAELLSEIDNIDVLTELKNGRETLEYLKTHSVDLIFMDIQMPGINGLDVVNRLSTKQKPIIVFTTAYDQFAVSAFKASALDYLLKPFDKERLIESINRANELINLRRQSHFHERMVSLYQELEDAKSSSLTEFVVKEKGFEKIIKVKDILWIESNSVYVELHTQNHKTLYRAALKSLENNLPNNFVRIHRSILVNRDKVLKVSYKFNNTYAFHMLDGSVIFSSRSHKETVVEQFGPK